MFQSLGWQSAGNPHDWRRSFARAFAWLISVVNISFPLAVLGGLIG